MRTNVHKTAPFGDLVAAAFDKAAQYSTDPREVSRLATGAVICMLPRGKGGVSHNCSPWKRSRS